MCPLDHLCNTCCLEVPLDEHLMLRRAMTQSVGWCETFTIHNLAHLVSFFSGLNRIFSFTFRFSSLKFRVLWSHYWPGLNHFTLVLRFEHLLFCRDTFLSLLTAQICDFCVQTTVIFISFHRFGTSEFRFKTGRNAALNTSREKRRRISEVCEVKTENCFFPTEKFS